MSFKEFQPGSGGVERFPSRAPRFPAGSGCLGLGPFVGRYFNFFTALAILANAFFMGAETAWVTCSGDAEGRLEAKIEVGFAGSLRF